VSPRALITGAGSGIGRAIAEELVGAGYEVIASARAALDVAGRLELDVNDDASVARAVRASEPVDVLVNNAGFGVGGPTERVPVDAVKAMFETNVFGALRMIQAVLPGMRVRGGGAIVNISSMSSRFPWPLGGLYAASKAALESIGEALHVEVRPFGIRVFNVEPGVIGTDLRFESFGGEEPPYDALGRQWVRIFDRPMPGPEVVASEVRSALEGQESFARLPVGEDATSLLASRRWLGDREFEDLLLDTFAVEWSRSAEPA
jgi:NAD(P)-dependent dehydrogenase (short-subunit alcohol dehydrogenase family)